MGLLPKLSKAQSLYLDTNLYIYFFENVPKFSDLIEDIFNVCSQNKIQIIASQLLFTEILVKPLKINSQLTKAYLNLPQSFPLPKLQDVNHQIAIQAAQLRADFNLRSPDAIHAATALESKVDYFITSDKQFKKIKSLPSIIL